MKRINTLIIALGMAMSFSVAPAFAAPAETELMSVAAPDGQEVIRVSGAAKQTLVVYYVTGTKAASYAIDTEDQTITTNLQKGVYLLKVGKVVRKVSIS